jgi:AraC-like DNA-binding protein
MEAGSIIAAEYAAHHRDAAGSARIHCLVCDTPIPAMSASRRVRLGLCTSDNELYNEAVAICRFVSRATPNATVKDILSWIKRENLDVVIVDIDDPSIDSSLITSLSRVMGRSCLGAYCRPRPHLGDTISRAFHHGAAFAVVRGFDRLTDAIDCVPMAQSDGLPEDVYDTIISMTPRQLRSYLMIFLDGMWAGMNVDLVSGAAGISRGTLNRSFAAAGWRSPKIVFGWCRVVAAASLLKSSAVTVSQVAGRVGCSPRRLRTTTKATLGRSLRVAARTDTAILFQHFDRAVCLETQGLRLRGAHID